jgi:YD repeat-containing protein
MEPETMHPSRHVTRLAAFAMAVLMLPSKEVEGQQPSRSRQADPGTQHAAAGLESEPLQDDTLGLSINLPAGADASRENSFGNISIRIVDPSPQPVWLLRFQSLNPTLKNPAPQDIAQQQIDAFRQRGKWHRVLASNPSDHGGVEGWQLYVEQETDAGAKIVTGWLIMKTGEDTFLVASTQINADQFDRVRKVLDASLATMKLTRAEEVGARKNKRLEAGRTMLRSISEDNLRALVGYSQWFRHVRPGESGQGEAEAACSWIQISEGRRGELEPEREISSYTPAEQQTGLLIRIQGRAVVDASRDVYYDSLALYWLAWDRSEEAWSIRATQRQGAAERTESETGVRTSPGDRNAEGRLTVVKSTAQTLRRDPFEWSVPEVYLSQVEGWVLGSLLPRNVTEPMELAFYYFNSADTKVSMRVDRWGPASGQRDAKWMLVTRLSPDEPETTSYYDAEGNLLRRERADGALTVPVTADELKRIWQSKGLKLGGTSR